MNYCLGIDIGGTKVTVGLADENARPIVTESFATEAQRGADDLVQRIAQRYAALCKQQNIAKEQVTFAGVACPGPLDIKSGRIVHIATMGFRNVPIKAMIEQALGLPVYLENDANLAALAESVIGAGKGCDPLVYVTVSTGVGSGIVADGKILSGAFSSAGELGHLTVEPDGRPCPCGKQGCLELYSSGTAIGNDGSALAGEKLGAKEVFALARKGDSGMRAIIDKAADKLGLALSSVYHIIDPEVIVLGGSVTKDYGDFADALAAALTKYTQPVEGRGFNIKISRFDGEQVLLGALIYGKQEHALRSAQ